MSRTRTGVAGAATAGAAVVCVGSANVMAGL
jgi:hypothetical protein